MQIIKYFKITSTLKLITGTRIGGGSDILAIGGAENTCIKDPVNYQPYIPGSSLKGKMRSALELELGKADKFQGEPCRCAGQECLICRIFGPHKKFDHLLGPARIIVRDALLIDGGTIEFKESTAIDRQRGSARGGSLRSEERVVAGSTFGFEVVIKVMDVDSNSAYGDYDGKVGKGEDAFFNFIEHGCALIQQTGIGAGISRGNGQVQFLNFKKEEMPRLNLRSEG